MKTYNEFQDEMIDEDLGEKVVARARKTPAERRAQRMKYRKNRNRLKMAAKKYRKTAGYKMMQKKSKRMRKMGKTATGRDISVRGGSGSASRLAQMKKDIKR